MIKTKPLYINIIFTILALGLHAYLTNKFFALQSATSSGQSLCNLGGIWNCDAVSTSSYAQLLGRPIALWGFATHLVFLFLQIMVAWKQNAQDTWARLTVYFTFVVVVASIVMGTISLTKLNSACLFCLIAYGLSILNLALLSLAGFEFKKSFSSLQVVLQEKSLYLSFLSVPVLTFMLGASWAGNENAAQVQVFATDKVLAWQNAPAQSFDPALGLRLGAPQEQARMTIVEFADFRCPHCKHAAPSVKAFVQSRPDVALLFKAYPLDGTCNLDPALQGQGDGVSCRLAMAVFCAEKVNQSGWKTFDLIFDQQEELRMLSKVESVDQAICDLKLQDCGDMKTCLNDESTKVAIQKMAQEGTQAGLRGTPTFYINNRLLEGAQLIPVLEKTYEAISRGQSN